MGFWSSLGKIGMGIGGAVAAPFTGGASLLPTILGAAGAGLGAAANASANNRGQAYEGQLDLERLLMARDEQAFNNQIAREQEGRAGSSDALRKLFATSHVLNPGARPQLSPYSVAPRQASDAELTGANSLQQEVLARLQGGNPIQPFQQHPMAVDPSLLKSGFWEKLAGLGGAGLSMYGALARKPQPKMMSGVPQGQPYA